MALLSSKNNKVEKSVSITKVENSSPSSFNDVNGILDLVLLKPRVTEKATLQSEKNIYTFNVDPRANKNSIKAAVRKIFKVNPEKVAVVSVVGKRVVSRGKRGTTSVGKKAYVYLKKGDTINFV